MKRINKEDANDDDSDDDCEDKAYWLNRVWDHPLIKIFRKCKSSYHMIRIRACAYEVVRNLTFIEDFGYVCTKWMILCLEKGPKTFKIV